MWGDFLFFLVIFMSANFGAAVWERVAPLTASTMTDIRFTDLGEFSPVRLTSHFVGAITGTAVSLWSIYLALVR